MKFVTFFTLINALVASGAPGVERRDRTITITSTITQTITIYVTAAQDPTTVVATQTRDASSSRVLPTTEGQQQPPATSSGPSLPGNTPPPADEGPTVTPPVDNPSDDEPTNSQTPINEATDVQSPVTRPTQSPPSAGSPSMSNSPAQESSAAPQPSQPEPWELNDYIPVVLPGSVPPLVIYLPRPESPAPSPSESEVAQPGETTKSQDVSAPTSRSEDAPASTSNAESKSTSKSEAKTSTGSDLAQPGETTRSQDVAAPTSKSQDAAASTSNEESKPTSKSETKTSTRSEEEGAATTQLTLTTLPSQTATFTQVSSAPVETTTVTPEVSVTTISTTSGAVQILPTASTLTPSTEGTIVTSLHVTGAPTSAPVISTTISEPSTTISTSEVSSVVSTVVTDAPSVDVFVPIATDAPHGSIPRRDDHPVPRLGIKQKSPLETNKFYGNFFLGSQTDPTWTHPYSMSWAKGRGNSWGMAISHVDRDQASFGPDGQVPAQYFVNPSGIQSIVLSASELDSSTVLTTDSLTAFSANVNLAASEGQTPAITFPVVQGMGFVTGIYNGGTPVINSGVLFRTLTKVDKRVKKGITKYQIVLEDGKQWLLYASSADNLDLDLQVVNNGMIQATSNFNGFIQIAKNPGSGEEVFDEACGTYAESVDLFGSVGGDVGSYTFKFRKAGIADSALLMFALPHHVESFSGATAADITNLKLVTTTKGTATGVLADYWTMTEQLPTDMKFAPWSPETGSVDTLTEEAIAEIKDIAASEVSQNMDRQTNSDSMYFGGKALAKFAGVVYTLSELLDEKALGQAGLEQLKSAFGRFVNNQQQNPLVYESVWGGVVSSAAYVTGDSLADFGNTYYNDHHFHYGYHIYTAAVIAHLDPTVLEDNDFVSYVNTLLRDISNPSSADPYFPVQRAFDYYNGHSWAKGLFSSVDGKDQESTSEDMMHAYAIKAWGLAIGDANIIARGNLQLAVTARSVKNYFLYESDNKIQPSQIIGNKVSGILFENKVDHTTYFGTNIEYIQGIHMLPLLPCTALARSPRFVQEEWDTYFSNGRADNVNSGWRGILYGNLIGTAPQTAWDFFVGKNGWSADWIDGGASRTWYLAFAAAMRDGPQASRSSESRLMSIASVNQTSVASNGTYAETYKRSGTPFRGSIWSRIHLHKLHGH